MSSITLKEVKSLLNITDFNKDEYIQIMIPTVIGFVREYCENPQLPIENGAKIAVVKIIQFYMNNTSVQSKSISRVSETFLIELPKSILDLLEPYNNKNKVKFF